MLKQGKLDPNEKLCHKCGRVLAVDAFPLDGCSPCRQCRNARVSVWYYKNAKRLRKRSRDYLRAWRKKNPGYDSRKKPQQYNPVTAKRGRDKYRAKPGIREREREYNRKYYQEHRERLLAYKKRKTLEKVGLKER